MRPPGENRRRPETLVNSARALGSKTRTRGIFGRVIFGTSGIFGTVRLLGRIMGARREFAFLEGANDFRLSTKSGLHALAVRISDPFRTSSCQFILVLDTNGALSAPLRWRRPANEAERPGTPSPAFATCYKETASTQI
jgi:hypothetical protein